MNDDETPLSPPYATHGGRYPAAVQLIGTAYPHDVLLGRGGAINNRETDEDRALAKASQALREGSPQIRASQAGRSMTTQAGIPTPFPVKLYEILTQVEEYGLDHIISWQPHGRCFVVHEPELFAQDIMPKSFHYAKYATFVRQLNQYGFSRMRNPNPHHGGYYHERFLRGHPEELSKVTLISRSKGSPPDQDWQPDFYSMAPVGKDWRVSVAPMEQGSFRKLVPGSGITFENPKHVHFMLSTRGFDPPFNQPLRNVIDAYAIENRFHPTMQVVDLILDELKSDTLFSEGYVPVHFWTTSDGTFPKKESWQSQLFYEIHDVGVIRKRLRSVVSNRQKSST